MDELFNQELTPEQAATLREMERKSQDRILVYNPTERDYICRWDSRGFTIPSKTHDNGYGPGYAVQPRYVAKKYVKEMIELIRETQRVKAIVGENERRINNGQKAMDHYEERLQFEAQFKDDDPQFLARLVPILWRGIHEEYGMDDIQANESERRDTRTTQEKILAGLEKPAEKLAEDIKIEDITGGSQPVPTTPVNELDKSILNPVETSVPVTKDTTADIGNVDDILNNDPLSNVNPTAGSNSAV